MNSYNNQARNQQKIIKKERKKEKIDQRDK